MPIIAILATIPSAYALAAWGAILFLFYVSPLPTYPLSGRGVLVISFTLLVFCVSIFLNYNAASHSMKNDRPIVPASGDATFFIITSVIGVFGLIKYIMDFSAFLGGFDGFVKRFFETALDIRAAGAEQTSLGFQLSYFSWMSIFFGMFIVLRKDIGFYIKSFVLAITLSEFAMNLTFIDRTHPMTIVVVSFLGYLLKDGIKNIKFSLFAILAVMPFAIFLSFAIFSKKFDQSAGVLNNMYIYLLGGITFLDSLVSDQDVYIKYIPERIFYPVARAYELLLGNNDFNQYRAPSLIIEFRYNPFSTNVGTVIEPFYSDGGLIFVFFMFPLFVIFSDYFAIWFLRQKTVLGTFMWANIVYAALLSFFVSRWNNAYLYLYLAIWIFSRILMGRIKDEADVASRFNPPPQVARVFGLNSLDQRQHNSRFRDTGARGERGQRR
jgi:oligosaccharide repeat unit polymerase